MADENITYATVTFRPTTQLRFKAENEETVYAEVKVSHQNSPGPNEGLLQDEAVGIKSRLSQLFPRGCGILCWFLLLAFIIGLSAYISSSSTRYKDDLSQLRTNQTKLLENSQNQTHLHNTLLFDYENLRKDHTNLTKLWSNLKDMAMHLQMKIQNISAQNQQLELQNKELKEKNEHLKLEKANVEAEYRECQACPKNWKLLETKCYEVNEKKKTTWQEAQKNCKGTNSNLFLLDEPPKNLSSVHRFWIGLRVQNREWKWINGSNLSQTSSSKTPSPGHCAVSAKDKDWESVHCNNKNYWICEKEAISL
ncbi:hypothetical protein OJAV_G00163390 [Oryzias javanicus]|uniref:C-type lectin domain-containing protein n=1 Tax=Oryzias javanicus TaxID=123683 RepID=A0A3S2PK40_ORYJA|nr:hypothetical protein OJAV_G00163390 [Oryzias javanicus]